jgi:hypothetical protein
MREFEHWTIDELIEAHEVLDALERVELRAHADARAEAGQEKNAEDPKWAAEQARLARERGDQR